MKNFINYYYGFNIYNIYFVNGKYFFYNDQERYMLKVCDNPNMAVYFQELNYQLKQYNYFFSIVANRNSSYITWIEGKPYVLLKLSNITEGKISIFDIKTDLFFNADTKLSGLSRFPWTKLWENKIDYFEEWFFIKYEGYKKIYSLFHYFIGIAENALLYLKETEREEKQEQSDNLVIAHDRVTIDYDLYDYYDSSNVILDHASRDVSEYIKSMFLHRVWDLDVIKKYLEKHYFSRYGLRMLYARIVFPSFFFDYLEEMIVKNSDIDLLYLENRADEFQIFIKDISLFLQENYNLPVISWITKKT